MILVEVYMDFYYGTSRI